MGLDDFMDIDSSENEEESEHTDDKQSKDWKAEESELLDYKRFCLKDGKLARRGLVGFDTQESFKETVEDSIKIEELLAKFWYPIFPHIEAEAITDVGSRIHIKVMNPEESNKCENVVGVTSLSIEERDLYTIPRELVMLDTGQYEKEKALNVLSDRLGASVEPSTTVKLHMFGNYMSLAQTAVVNTNMREWTNKEYATLTESALRPGKLQELRRKWDDLHISELPKW